MTYKLNQFVRAKKHVSGSMTKDWIYNIVKIESPEFSRYLAAKGSPWLPEKDLQYVYWIKRNEQISVTLHENVTPYD